MPFWGVVSVLVRQKSATAEFWVVPNQDTGFYGVLSATNYDNGAPLGRAG